MGDLETNKEEEVLEKKKSKLHKFGSALLSVKGQIGYPHLIPISYLRKKNTIYISKQKSDFELPDIEFGTYISYSIVGYEQIIPMKLEDSPDSLFTIDVVKNILDPDMEETYTSFINKFAEGRVEVGVGYVEEYQQHDSILVIKVEKSSRDSLKLDEI